MTLVCIRNAAPTDFAALVGIRTDPRVIPHQHKCANPGEMFGVIVCEGRYQDCPDVRLTTILNHDTVVGYVMHSHIEDNEVRVSQCGWCLHPDCWGRGIMTMALTQLLDDLILNENRTHVLANCFSENQRCIKLLHRLGFVRWRFGLAERVRSMIKQQSLKWELRFGLTPETWDPASRENAV